MSFPHLEVVPPGLVLDVRFCNEGGEWCKVSLGSGTIGFVRRQFLRQVGDVYRGPSVGLYVGVAPAPAWGYGGYGGYGHGGYRRRW